MSNAFNTGTAAYHVPPDLQFIHLRTHPSSRARAVDQVLRQYASGDASVTQLLATAQQPKPGQFSRISLTFRLPDEVAGIWQALTYPQRNAVVTLALRNLAAEHAAGSGQLIQVRRSAGVQEGITAGPGLAVVRAVRRNKGQHTTEEEMLNPDLVLQRPLTHGVKGKPDTLAGKLWEVLTVLTASPEYKETAALRLVTAESLDAAVQDILHGTEIPADPLQLRNTERGKRAETARARREAKDAAARAEMSTAAVEEEEEDD